MSKGYLDELNERWIFAEQNEDHPEMDRIAEEIRQVKTGLLGMK